MNMNNENNLPANQHHNLFFEDQPVRIVEKDQGQLWFVAKDACDILELVNSREALKGLDNDELMSEKLTSGGQLREMNLVSEPGLYRLVARSNKPQAKRFQRWLYHDVLPSIRRTGCYALAGMEGVSTGDAIERIAAAMIPAITESVVRLVSDQMAHSAGVLPRIGNGLRYKFATGHIISFIDERCQLGIDKYCPKELLYFHYKLWCEDNEEVPYDYSNFCKALYQTGLPLRKVRRESRRTGKTEYMIRGILVGAEMRS